MTVNQQFKQGDFRQTLKYWRSCKKMSQLDLAVSAEVSQRHVSWLETGRSKPSREMVLRLSEAMDVPLRDRNQILNSAGFASAFSEKALSEPTMRPVMKVLEDMLDHHNPFPAIVLDRLWNIKMKNQAAEALFDFAGQGEQMWSDIGDDGSHNLALFSLHPKGLRQYISNWDEVGSALFRRLRRETIDSGDTELIDKFKTLESIVGDMPEENPNISLLPILPLEFVFPGSEFSLSLFSVISTFGTAQDITADELRIEAFFPTDDATRHFFSQ